MQEIAIIGMSGRFPGAKNIDEFCSKIWSGTELISHYTDEQILANGADPNLIVDSHYVKAASVLSDVECFDADFFGYSVREARALDPQQRIFLECAWEAMEVAGYSTDNLDLSVGVFAGASANTYILDGILNQHVALDLNFMNYVETRLASDKDFLATRVSYKLNLTGPSFTVQSACSTSLVAIHTACQNLLSGECDLALAGAVTVLYPLNQGYMHKPESIVSPDGHCRTFSAAAQGTVFGSGVGAVVLKRLEDAVADQDNVLAIIKGSAVNNDGSLKPSYTTPSLDLQAEVVGDAMVLSDVMPETIGYVEAHGTGTLIGDPIEVAALTQAYREFTDQKQYCPIGSVKTNIGHLDVAAGMASLIKTVLVLQNKEIPPSLHFDEPNPQIDFENSPFYVNTRLQPFVRGTTQRRAGVTALGVGGTNVHMILEESPTLESTVTEKPQIVIVSAKTSKGLSQARKNLAAHLTKVKSLQLGDVAFTTQVGRRRFAWRRSFVCQNTEEAIKQLENSVLPEQVGTESANLSFILSDISLEDMSNVWELYGKEVQFRQDFDMCIAAWNSICDRSELEEASLDLADVSEVLNSSKQPESSLPEKLISFGFSYALIRLLISWGLKPQDLLLVGDGELIGACIAGILPLNAALMLIGKCWGSFSVSQVEQLDHLLVEQVDTKSTGLFPIYECKQGQWLPLQLVDILNHSGAFSSSITTLPVFDLEASLLLIIGGQDMLDDDRISQDKLIRVFERKNKEDVYVRLLHTVGLLWERGVQIDWLNLHQGQLRRRVVLPTYPFERKLYRYEENSSHKSPGYGRTTNSHPLLHNRVHSPFIDKSVFECHVGFGNFPYLHDHRVFGQAIVPGSFHISLVLSAAQEIYGAQPVGITGLLFGKALFIDENSDRQVQLIVDTEAKKASGESAYKLLSCSDKEQKDSESWLIHSQGAIVKLDNCDAQIDLEILQQRCSQRVTHQEFYDRGQKRGFEWQGDFRSLKAMWHCPGEALALLEYSTALQKCIGNYTVHPAILDACLQPYLLTNLASLHGDDNDPFIPLSIKELKFYRQPTKKLWIHAYLSDHETQNQDTLAVDIKLYNDTGQIFMEIAGLRTIRMPQEQLMAVADNLLTTEKDYIYRPTWQLSPPPLKLPGQENLKQHQDIIIVDHGQDPWRFADLIVRHFKTLDSGFAVSRITLGNSWLHHLDAHLEIDCTNPAHYSDLLPYIPKSSSIYFLGGFAYQPDLLNLSRTDADELNILERSQTSGIYALFWLSKSLIAIGHKDITLRILTHDLYRITDRDRHLYPFGGGLIGFAKVLAREQPQMSVSCTDLSSEDLEQMGSSSVRVATVINVIEQTNTNVNLCETALRDGFYFRKKLIEYTSFDSVKSGVSTQAFCHRGVYLILGGAGGIGVALSIFLAEKYQANSIWVGRSPISEKVNADINQVALAGGKAEYIQADATSLAEMEVVRSKIQERFGVLNGVIHSALVLNDKSIAKMEVEDFRSAFDIKVKATLVLEQITRNDSLDFIAFFSSENALRGWHGLSNYVAGCTFKDNYGYYLQHNKKRPIKIFNWGFWGETGIAAQENIRNLVQKQGILPMTTDEGIEIFETGLTQESLQIVATKIDSRIKEHLGIDEQMALSQIAAALPTSISTIERQLNQFISNYSGETENSWLPNFIDWVRYLALELVRDLGVNIDAGQPFDRYAIAKSFKIEPKFAALFAALEDMLIKAGFLVSLDGQLYFTDKAHHTHTSGAILQQHEFKQRYPQAASWIELVDEATKNFLPIVKGQIKATDILFPNGSNQLVENIYQGNCVSDYFNRLATETVIGFVERLTVQNTNAKVRILEFGSGTGSTTRLLLNKLKQAIPQAITQVEYVFTDVSAHFTNKAQQQLEAAYPFVSFQTFNMEKSPEQQGFPRGTFDLVLGTNVIHVCADILSTVGRLKSLLKQNGILMLNELTEINDVWTLTFGLLDGWWLAQDKYLRLPHTPLLSKQAWQSILDAQGLKNVSIFTQPQLMGSDNAPQCLIMGESDGLIEISTQANTSKSTVDQQFSRSAVVSAPSKITFTDVDLADIDQRYDLLGRYLKGKVAETLEISVADIAENKPIGDFGMDSLIVLDFCDRLSREMGKSIPTTMVFDYPTLEVIVEYVAKDILGWQQQTSPGLDLASVAISPIAEILDSEIDSELDNLSPQEIEALLEAELE